MSETSSASVPIAALRPVPGPPPRPTRFPATRLVLRAGTIIVACSVFTAASCGTVAAGWHGLAFATALFSAMGAVGMTFGLAAAVAVDGRRVARGGLDAGLLVHGRVHEREVGQLSVTPEPEAGQLSLPSPRALRPSGPGRGRG